MAIMESPSPSSSTESSTTEINQSRKKKGFFKKRLTKSFGIKTSSPVRPSPKSSSTRQRPKQFFLDPQEETRESPPPSSERSTFKTEIFSSISNPECVSNNSKRSSTATASTATTSTSSPALTRNDAVDKQLVTVSKEPSSLFFFSGLCGGSKYTTPLQQQEDFSQDDVFFRQELLPDDPTVQESIECIFAHQLKEGIAFLHEEEEHNDNAFNYFSKDELQKMSAQDKQTPHRPYVRRQSGSFTHVGTFDPSVPDSTQVQFRHVPRDEISPKKLQESPKKKSPSKLQFRFLSRDLWSQDTESPSKKTSKPSPQEEACRSPRIPGVCCCKLQKTPILDTQDWPQAPLLLRPTPGSGTKVMGIRLVNSNEYLWSPDNPEQPSWPEALRQHWKQAVPQNQSPRQESPWKAMCQECMVLPINNGKEAPGESLVVDFCSDLFCGTLLLRIRDTHGTTCPGHESARGYFDGMNRRYQVVIRGRFLKPINLLSCSTGFALERPCGKMPPKWITKGAVKVVTFFAPQLQVQMDGPKPSSQSPLGSTPQVLAVKETALQEKYQADGSLEEMQKEPTRAHETLLEVASDATSTLQRARFRKRQFDKLVVDSTKKSFLVDVTKEYTFEFLQHMIRFQDFQVELGSFLGCLNLAEMLNGQPLQIMAMENSCKKKLWSFDVWHTNLIQASKHHDANSS